MSSYFSHIEEAPKDPILGITEAFKADPRSEKVNLGVGIYQNAQGKTVYFDAVIKASEILKAQGGGNPSYLPIDGLPEYCSLTQELLFGKNSPVIQDKRAVTLQALGGTGALRIGADFIKKYFSDSHIWISNPSWENHRALFETVGFTCHPYPYYDVASATVDYTNFISKLKELPHKSIVLLHACCHNPTGNDLSKDQWREVLKVCESNQLIPFLDFAYQGFAESIEEDAFSVRLFAESGIPCLIANSYSKSFGLYNERDGALTIVTGNKAEAGKVQSQIKRIARTNYSNPPAHGAQIVSKILSDPSLRSSWQTELASMNARIKTMRESFVKKLATLDVDRDFSFVLKQNGMFSYSGLEKEIVIALREHAGIYTVESGRICIAALNENNIDYVCEKIAEELNRVGSCLVS